MLLNGYDWAVIAAFFVLLALIPTLASLKSRGTAGDFFNSGHSMPWWLIGFSMVAATTATDSANFFTQVIRTDGMSGNWIMWAFILTGLLTVFVVNAEDEMSEVRTGALIVLEQNILLTEYIDTGIMLDAEVSSQLLINIFEHNTPLHDGAVILRGDRITAATCYLPLSDNAKISKKYGTRHRAGLGISEASDSFTIIVSEETGRVSCAYMGVLTTGVTASGLREQLHQMQKRTLRMRDARIPRFRKGWKKDET